MNPIVKPYLLRASLLAGLAIILGLALSFVIYQTTEKVRTNAIDLVDNRIPVLTSINQLIADLSEQERIIYEYYRSQDAEAYLPAFEANTRAFAMHSKALSDLPVFVKESREILNKQAEIEALSNEFHIAMQLDEDNWDYLRELLTQISDIRRAMLPTLLQIEAQTQQTVEEGHMATLSQMERTHNTVILYGISIILLAGVVSWYIRQYILTNAKNTRLAMFSHRNPNPILSVNNLGEVVFSNPACAALLANVGLDEKDTKKLLPRDFIALRQELSLSDEPGITVEQELNQRILQINVNWLKELDAYDIHIVDVTKRRLAEQKVKHIAFYVQETNLPNQYKLNNDLDELIASGQKLSLGIFEIRDFTKIVSSIGVEPASELVKVLSELVSEKLPAGVRFYQLNESQFALLCTKRLSTVQLQVLSSDIMAVAEDSLQTHCGEFFLELDFGYCLFPEHGVDRNSLYKNAHTALGIASEDDHTYFALYKVEYGQAITASAAMVDNLRNAIEGNGLFLVFQPQLDLHKQKVIGIETLVRWRHDDNIVSPAEFIPLAEQSGLIVPIGQWILQQACIFTSKLVRQGFSDIVVAVNVSPRQFSHPGFIQSVKSVLADNQLPAKNLELEITEGVIMHNEEGTLAALHQLKSLGIQLSIDDFGTGYSSLSYLKRFPVDKLKIDQSFIRDMHQNAEDKALVKTIVTMGKSLGLTLIAEGVEESEHVEFLREIACDEIQGYWFSRPLEADDLLKFLHRQQDSMAS